MNKNTLIGVVVVVVIAFAWWMMANQPAEIKVVEEVQVTEAPEITEETVVEVETELDGLDYGNLDAEFEELDAELDNL